MVGDILEEAGREGGGRSRGCGRERLGRVVRLEGKAASEEGGAGTVKESGVVGHSLGGFVRYLARRRTEGRQSTQTRQVGHIPPRVGSRHVWYAACFTGLRGEGGRCAARPGVCPPHTVATTLHQCPVWGWLWLCGAAAPRPAENTPDPPARGRKITTAIIPSTPLSEEGKGGERR